MDVEDIEAEITADFRHFDGQRQRVIRILEQAVIVDDDRMEKNMRRIRLDAKRSLLADEVNLVSTPREFLAKCRGEYSAAADRGITRDADFERTLHQNRSN